MAELQLKNIKKKYDKDVVAVEDFNLQIQDKEFIVFVGPSGCGKSTTLRMIAGLEDITEGELYINGKKMNDVPSKDREIAMVFQNYALYPHMNVFDNMAFGLKLRKVRKEKIQEKVQQAAKILGLEDYLDRKPKALSGGQRQRVALGRAIVRESDVFLMDEPLSNLDAKLRVQMRAEIQKLHKRLQTTTIYVTHDQTEAMTMATRLVVMKDGHIQQIGAPKEVYHMPINVFVGGFIGSPSMNFLNGSIVNSNFVSGNVNIKIPETRLKTLIEKGYNDKPIILGVRPEDIYEPQKATEVVPNTTIKTSIDVVELHGAETFIYCKVNEQELTARVDANSSIKAGDTTELAFDMDKAHFFDSNSEKRIW